MQIQSLYFIIPRLLAQKKRGEIFLSPWFKCCLLELRFDVVGVVGFVRLAKVALTAELCRRRCARAGVGLQVRVVGSVDKEVGGVPFAAAIALDLAGCARSVNRHHVLVVAGGADYVRSSSGGDAVGVRPFSRCQRWPSVVGYELSILAARGDAVRTAGA